MPPSGATDRRTALGHSVPFLFGRETYRRAALSILAFELYMVGGEWLLHQIVYVLAFRGRFDAVMGATPHRWYMGPIGVALLVLGVLSACALLLFCLRAEVLRSRLLRVLPERVRRRLPVDAWTLPWTWVARTALLLACLQGTLFAIQENLEADLSGGRWVGLAVFVAGWHLAVLPIDALVASCLSIILWGIASLLWRASASLRMARTLAAIFSPARSARPRSAGVGLPFHRTRDVATERTPRSPPLVA